MSPYVDDEHLHCLPSGEDLLRRSAVSGYQTDFAITFPIPHEKVWSSTMISDFHSKVFVAILCTALVYYVGTKKPAQNRNTSSSITNRNEKVAASSGGFGPKDSVTVRVPATTANMGPGFDSIGMALDIWNELTVERAPTFSFTNEGKGAEVLPTDETNLVVIGLKAAFKAAGKVLYVYHPTSKIWIMMNQSSSSSFYLWMMIFWQTLIDDAAVAHPLPQPYSVRQWFG